ncbi:MAG: SDR family NAD(P)-dependent oxidoreductase [Nitrososphaerales archaeon]|jgi:NAD(P)-dependent dehydrogenase (short-subunit alcohol dehydrogenase family)
MGASRVALVTGASSGFGKAIATLLAGNGFDVYGTSRRPERPESDGFRMLALDVTSDESVSACVRSVLDGAGRIDLLVNNAGFVMSGAIEETSVEEAKAQFETNFFGVMRVTREVLPAMRERRSGRIVMMGSVGGLLPSPFEGVYVATKHALEGYAETLRLEVAGFGVKVSIIEPGFFKTGLFKSETPVRARIPDYDAPRKNASTVREGEHRAKALDPRLVADLVLRVANSSSPRLRYTIGRERGAIRLKKVIPEGIYESFTRKHWKLDDPRAA